MNGRENLIPKLILIINNTPNIPDIRKEISNNTFQILLWVISFIVLDSANI